jgi:hypothetical protein
VQTYVSDLILTLMGRVEFDFDPTALRKQDRRRA